MADSVQIWPLSHAVIGRGSVSQIAAYGPMLGGRVINPADGAGQGLVVAEDLFIDLTGPATLYETPTTFRLYPSQSFDIPPGFTGRVWVTAASRNHRYSGFIIFPPTNFHPDQGPWPPSGPTTLTKLIPSYLYQQYADDDDLQAFVGSFNSFAQQYVDWFVQTELPVITNPNVNTALLDWVVLGLYGMSRPVLPNDFVNQDIGAFNTYALNEIPFNGYEHIGPSTYYIVNDDIFRRILIWHLWRGDGKLFDIRWLKRRIKRFLSGLDGGPGQTDDTYAISITFGVGNAVSINIQTIRFVRADGALFNTNAFNTFAFNELANVETVSIPPSPFVSVFKAAIFANVLELPFQYEFTVNIN